MGNHKILIIDTSFVTFAHVGSVMLVDDLEITKVVGIDDSDGKLTANEFMLNQNYPNPFNPKTTISYIVSELSLVTIKVYDVLGSEIATLVNEEKPIGSYEVELSSTGLPSGIYLYRLQAGDFIETKKMILMK